MSDNYYSHLGAAIKWPTDWSVPFPAPEVAQPRNQLEPEQMLMLAVLEDGIMRFQKYITTGNRLFHEAEEWLVEEDNDWPFSFKNICEALALNGDSIRQELIRWKSKMLTEPWKVYPLAQKREAKKARAAEA